MMIIIIIQIINFLLNKDYQSNKVIRFLEPLLPVKKLDREEILLLVRHFHRIMIIIQMINFLFNKDHLSNNVTIRFLEPITEHEKKNTYNIDYGN